MILLLGQELSIKAINEEEVRTKEQIELFVLAKREDSIAS